MLAVQGKPGRAPDDRLAREVLVQCRRDAPDHWVQPWFGSRTGDAWVEESRYLFHYQDVSECFPRETE